MQRISCPNCDKRLKVLAGNVSGIATCPRCGKRITVAPAEKESATTTEIEYQPGMLPPSKSDEPPLAGADPTNRVVTDDPTQNRADCKAERVTLPTEKQSRKRHRRQNKSIIAIAYLLVGIGTISLAIVVIIMMRRHVIDSASPPLPDSVRNYIFGFYRESDGSLPRIAGIEYYAIKGRTAPTFDDVLQQMAREKPRNGWPGSRHPGHNKNGAFGNGRPDNEQVIWEEDPNSIIPKVDLRVDGAYLVKFRRPVKVTPPLPGRSPTLQRTRLVFIMRPGGSAWGNPFDTLDPDELGQPDWRAAVRLFVKDDGAEKARE